MSLNSNVRQNTLNTKKKFSYFSKLGQDLSVLSKISYLKKASTESIKQACQGVLNYQVIPMHLDRVWPYWVRQQLYPESTLFNSNSDLGILVNSTYRNWTNLSFPGFEEKLIIDQKGLISTDRFSWSLDTWLCIDGQLVAPSMLKNVYQTYLPKVKSMYTYFTVQKIQLKNEVFFSHCSLEDPFVFYTSEIKNTSDKPLKFSFLYVIRPYSPEGVSRVENLCYLSSNTFIINDKVGLILDQKPSNIVCSNFNEGGVEKAFQFWEMVLQASCEKQLGSGFAEFRLKLDPGQDLKLSCKLPFPKKNSSFKQLTKKIFMNQNLKMTKKILEIKSKSVLDEKIKLNTKWNEQLEGLLKIEVPNKDIQTVFNQSIVHLFSNSSILNSNTEVKSISRKQFSILSSLLYLGDTKYIIKYLNKLETKLRRKWTKRLKPIEIARELLIITKYYAITKDSKLVKSKIPFILKSIKYLSRKRVKYSKEKPELTGLLKKRASEKKLNVYDYHFEDNFWAYAALKNVLPIVKQYLDLSHLRFLQSLINSFEKSINHYFNHLINYNEKASIPVGVDQNNSSDILGALSGVYPLDLSSIQTISIGETLKEIEKKYMVNGVFFNASETVGYSTYDNLLLGNIYISLKNNKFYKCLDWVSNSVSSSGAFAESIHPLSKGGSAGDGHFNPSNSEYINLIRRMMVNEVNQELHLLSIIPKNWIVEGNNIKINNAKTIFGQINLNLDIKSDNKCDLYLNNKYHSFPVKINVNFPFLIDKISINGTDKVIDGYQFITSPNIKKVEIFFSIT